MGSREQIELEGQELAKEQEELRKQKLDPDSALQQTLLLKEEQELAKKEQLKMAKKERLENIKRQYDLVNQEHPVSPKNYNQIRQIEKLEGELKAAKASKQKQDNSKKLQRPTIVKRMDISLCKKHSMIQETHEKAEAVKLNRKLLEKKTRASKARRRIKEKI